MTVVNLLYRQMSIIFC